MRYFLCCEHPVIAQDPLPLANFSLADGVDDFHLQVSAPYRAHHEKSPSTRGFSFKQATAYSLQAFAAKQVPV